MRILTVSCLLLVLIHQCVLFSDEPEEEFRAVWLTTYAGLDWPKSFDIEEQKRSLLEILDLLKEAHFNAIIFQARSRGDAFYKSAFEPWARELTGSIGNNPGWDPLAFLIEQAHSRNIEVHAWFNVYKVWGGIPIPFDLVSRHILDSNPGWARFYDNEWWLDPGEPGVHAHLLKVALDLVERYPIDGIHFDHIRYPGRDFDDSLTYQRFGKPEDLHEWRRDNITNFVRDFYTYATAIRPELKVGSAPMGVYRSVAGFNGASGYLDYYQDAERWLREGIHDYIVPQVYWNVLQHPRFDVILRDWMKRTHGRHIYAGIGVFRSEILNEVYHQVSIARGLDTPGQVFFRYEHLNDTFRFAKRYASPASIPRMEWKEKLEPTHNYIDMIETSHSADWMPVHLRRAMYDNDQQKNNTPEKEISRLPQRYIIYRSDTYPINTNNPDHLLAVLPATTASFTVEMHNPSSSDFHYLVSMLNGREVDDFPANTLYENEIDEIAKLLDREIILPLKPDPNDPDSYHITLYTPRGMSTSMKLVDEDGDSYFTIIEGFLDAGFHTIPIHIPAEKPFVTCIITVNDRTTERILKRAN